MTTLNPPPKFAEQHQIVDYYENLARKALRSRWRLFGDFISSPQFMVGVFVGTWAAVISAFGIAFL